jgi:hypothetical protein
MAIGQSLVIWTTPKMKLLQRMLPFVQMQSPDALVSLQPRPAQQSSLPSLTLRDMALDSAPPALMDLPEAWSSNTTRSSTLGNKQTRAC